MFVDHEAAVSPQPLGYFGPPVSAESELPELPFDGVELAPDLHVMSSADPVHGKAVKRASQVLQTRVYLKNEFTQPDELDGDGIYRDRWDQRSTYFYVRNGVRDGTVRMISSVSKERGGIASLPTFQEFVIDPDALKTATGARKLTDIRPEDTVEVSALASLFTHKGKSGDLDAIPALYATMLRHSLEQGHTTWVFNTYDKVQERLAALIGADQLHTIGMPRDHRGSFDTPLAIRPQEVVRKLLGSDDPEFDFHKAYLKLVFDGMDGRNVPNDIRDMLTANGIEWSMPSRRERLLGTRKALARVGFNAGLLAYTAVRAVPLSQVPEFHGNAAIFWGLDAVPIPAYTWGLEQAVTGRTATKRALGAVTASAAFAAPYAYAYAEGNNYPGYVNAAVAGFIGIAAVGQIREWFRRPRRESALMTRLSAMPEEKAA